MARIELFLNSIARFGATSVKLASGSTVCLRFPSGERFANQVTQHPDLIALVEEIAPPAVLQAVRSGAAGRFQYEHQSRAYSVAVDPKPGAWTILIEAPGGEGVEASVASGKPVGQSGAAQERPSVSGIRPGPSPEDGHAAGGLSGAPRMIEKLMIRMLEMRASDLHLVTGSSPYVRLHGEIIPLSDQPPYSADLLLQHVYEITPQKNRKEFEERSDTDFAHPVPGVARFRVNVFRDRKGPGAVFRAIPLTIMTPEQLRLPQGVLDFCNLNKGLVLVTGPTGSGKSTTLATLIDIINTNRAEHIITIEDPIEFVHESKRCLVNQREVRIHTRSFKDALRAALREDPDIVLVGEMRDLETIAIAVETAETGHLVFATLHTTTAPSTVDRIIDQFPPDRQEQIRQMLSESLRGVVCQTLCKKAGGGGRVAAYEILIGSSAVANLVREKKSFQLYSLMQTGRAAGMMTLNDSLIDLVKRKMVEPSEAYIKSVNKVEFRNLLTREGIKLADEPETRPVAAGAKA